MQHGLSIFGIAVAIQRIFTHCTARIAKFFVYSAFQPIYRNYTQMIGNKWIKDNSTLKLQLAWGNLSVIFLVCNHVTRRPCWGQYNRILLEEFPWKESLVPKREQWFCSWPPTWPPWSTSRANHQFTSVPIRYKIVTWLRGFLVIFLYLVWFSLCSVSSANSEKLESWKFCNVVWKAQESC